MSEPTLTAAPHAADPSLRRSSRTGKAAVVLGGLGSTMVLLTAAWLASIWNDPAYQTAGSVVSLVVAAVALLALVPGVVALLLAAIALRRPGRDVAARWGLGLGVLAVAPTVLLVTLVLTA